MKNSKNEPGRKHLDGLTPENTICSWAALRFSPGAWFFFFVVLLFSSLIGCQKQGEKLDGGHLIVAVSVEPHAFLLERIGGDRIRVEVLVPTGKEPESYQPTPDKIAMLSHAKVLFRTGMPFEETLIPKLKSNSIDLKTVDLREGIILRKIELHDHASHTAHHSSHDDHDPHIWFAPTILKTETQTILKTLLEIDPDGAASYQENADRLLEEIETLRLELSKHLAPFFKRTVFVFHPSYGYFCDEFNLRQRAVEFEGKSPKPQQLAALIAEVQKEDRPPIIFVQPEFNQAPALAIAEATGGSIVVHSALDHNVLQSMKRFAELLTK